MSLNLIDAAKSLFSSELVNKASSFLGESETGVAKAITGILPTVFNGLINKTSTHEGAGEIAKMAGEQQHAGILDNLGGLLDNGSFLQKGTGLLSSLFGNKADAVTGLLSNFSGLKSSSVTSLLSMAIPAVLGLIGKHSTGGASGIADLLNGQKENIAAAMPSGLNINSVLGGWNGDQHISAAVATPANHSYAAAENNGSSLRILLPLLLLALAAMGAWYLFGKGCNKPAVNEHAFLDSLKATTEQTTTEVKNEAAAVTGKVDSLTGDFIYEPGNNISIELPNGAGKLEVGENSTENKLYKFLSNPHSVLDTVKGNWFEFTNVKFKTGSPDITDASLTQLQNMVAIAKAYPAAQFKLGGYTDTTGSAAANIALSQKRADAVVVMLKKLGAPESSIAGAKGYGSQWPVADNTTAAGRAQNRRVAVNVKAK